VTLAFVDLANLDLGYWLSYHEHSPAPCSLLDSLSFFVLKQ
jgi:hypothetical protein